MNGPPWSGKSASWTLARAGKLDSPHLLPARVTLVGNVPDGLRRVVGRLDGGNLVFTALHLVGQLCNGVEGIVGVERVAVDVGVAVAPAENQELAIAEELHVVGHGEIFRLGLFEDAARFTSLRVGKPEVEVLVVAGESLDPHDAGVDPSEAGDVVVADVHGDSEPTGIAATGAYDADAHARVRVAGLRVALLINAGVDRDPVHERVLRDVGLVHLQVGDLP